MKGCEDGRDDLEFLSLIVYNIFDCGPDAVLVDKVFTEFWLLFWLVEFLNIVRPASFDCRHRRIDNNFQKTREESGRSLHAIADLSLTVQCDSIAIVDIVCKPQFISWTFVAVRILISFLSFFFIAMPAITPGSKVLVTGANGYVAVWVVKTLLERGFSVRSAVRSEGKAGHLRKLFSSYGDKHEVFIVEDIAKVRPLIP